MRDIDELLALDPDAPLSEPEECVIRLHFGYAESETRTRLQRWMVAEKMLAGKPRVQMERPRGDDLRAGDPKPDFHGIVEQAKGRRA